MDNTDFFDDDLIQRRDSGRDINATPSHEASPSGNVPRADAASGQDLNLAPLTKRKDEINSQVASKMDELERLRARREALENEKKTLEVLRSNQEKYETGKREMVDRLEQSLVGLEREEVQLNQHVQLISDTGRRFREMLTDLKHISESDWPTDSSGFREVLTKSLAVVEDTRKEFGKSLARVESLRESRNGGSSASPMLTPSSQSDSFFLPRNIADWVKIGLAFSLPTTLLLATILAVVLLLRGSGY